MLTRPLRCAAGLAVLAIPSFDAAAGLIGAGLRFNEQATLDARALGGALADAQVYELFFAFDTSDDVVLSIFDTSIGTTNGSVLYQDPGGTDLPPTDFVVGLAPTARYDSFVTLNLLTENTTVATDSEFAFTSDGVVGGWFNTSPPNELGATTLNAAEGWWETIAGRFTLESVETSGFWIGDGGLAFNQGAGTVTTILSTWSSGIPGGGLASPIEPYPIPTPGAAAILGLAGLSAARRRR